MASLLSRPDGLERTINGPASVLLDPQARVGQGEPQRGIARGLNQRNGEREESVGVELGRHVPPVPVGGAFDLQVGVAGVEVQDAQLVSARGGEVEGRHGSARGGLAHDAQLQLQDAQCLLLGAASSGESTERRGPLDPDREGGIGDDFPLCHDLALAGKGGLDQRECIQEIVVPPPLLLGSDASAGFEGLEIGGVGANDSLKLRLRFAPNPFDHLDLLRAGIREWASSPDAALAGKRLPVRSLERVFLHGLGSGAFHLLLIHAFDPVKAKGEKVGMPIGGLEDSDPGAAEKVNRIAVREAHLGGPVHGNLLSLASILGFDILSRDSRGWLSGHLLHLKPEHRGRDLARRAYFPAVVDLARRSGAKGFRFLSTLPAWRSVTILHSELYLRQKNGPDVWAFWRATR